MADATLVEPKVQAGRELVHALDSREISVPAALWWYLADSGDWRLLLAMPLADKEGPLAAYREIDLVLRSPDLSNELALDDISVISPGDPLVRTLGKAIATGPGLAGVRFRQNVINGLLVEDAFIYRLTQ